MIIWVLLLNGNSLLRFDEFDKLRNLLGDVGCFGFWVVSVFDGLVEVEVFEEEVGSGEGVGLVLG